MSDSNTSSMMPHKKLPLPLAILLTLAIVIFIREGSVFVCQALGYASAANIVGMITLFIILMLWRFSVGLPEWITSASNTLLVDSGFAFLPVSAGAGLLMFGLGTELWGIVVTIIVSTLLPLWGLATLANYWLGGGNGNPTKPTDSSEHSHTEAASTSSSSNNQR